VPTPSNKSIAKAIRVLEIVCGSPAHLSIREIALRANYSLATTHRVLSTLKQVGAVQATTAGCFTLGPKLVELHERIAVDLSRTRELVEHELHRLLEEPGVSARLSLFVESRLVIVAGCDSGVHHRFRSRIGGRYEAYCTAPGKTLLASLPHDKLDAYLRSAALLPVTRNTIIEPNRLRRELNHVRAVGYAFDEQEFIEGVRCVSVPIPTADYHEVAALSISTESYAPKDLIGRVLPRLTSRAEALARELSQLPRGIRSLLDAMA
jgi:DNA-binding IclR family transcriptional regulator